MTTKQTKELLNHEKYELKKFWMDGIEKKHFLRLWGGAVGQLLRLKVEEETEMMMIGLTGVHIRHSHADHHMKPLSITSAGCGVVVQAGEDGFGRKLVNIKRLIPRIPSAGIQLLSADEKATLAPNKESNLQPILAMMEVDLQLRTEKEDKDKE